MLQRGLEQSWNGPPNHLAPENVSPRAEAWPRGADSAAVAAGGCCGLCIAEKDSWRLCTRTCCPQVWLLSLIIFSVRFSSVLGIVLGFHRHLHEMWVDACLHSICATCAVCYIVRRECVGPCKSWTLGCCIICYWMKTVEENLTTSTINGISRTSFLLEQ